MSIDSPHQKSNSSNFQLYEKILENELLKSPLSSKKQSSLFEFKKPNIQPESPRVNRLLFPESPQSSKFQTISSTSQELLTEQRPEARLISKTPFKVLDAPELQVILFLKMKLFLVF